MVQVYLKNDRANSSAWLSLLVVVSDDCQVDLPVVPGRCRNLFTAVVEDTKVVPNYDSLVTLAQSAIDELNFYINEVP